MTVRLTEHKRNCRNGEITWSGVAQHTLQDNHRIDWEKSTVIAREPNYYKRRVKEALFIKKHHNMNQDQGLAVSPIWNITLWYCTYYYLVLFSIVSAFLWFDSFSCVLLSVYIHQPFISQGCLVILAWGRPTQSGSKHQNITWLTVVWTPLIHLIMICLYVYNAPTRQLIISIIRTVLIDIVY